MDQANEELKKEIATEPFEVYVAKTLGIKTAAGIEALKVAIANTVLLDKKHQDYGSKNISNHGVLGVYIRMDDKFSRLTNLLGKKRKRAMNESIRDTLRDISNYAIIALLVDSGKWPKE
jgi:DNA-directed RNA polymerase specialized sigma subunit